MTGHDRTAKRIKYKHYMMSNEKYHHLGKENSQYQNMDISFIKILELTKPSHIDKCKSEIETYLRRWPYLTEVLKGKYD